jgi:hypothetical protein
MQQRDRSATTDKQIRQAGVIEKSYEQKDVIRSEARAHAWATANKLHGGAKNGPGRKVPFGPTGGLGRKTNLSRSS